MFDLLIDLDCDEIFQKHYFDTFRSVLFKATTKLSSTHHTNLTKNRIASIKIYILS